MSPWLVFMGGFDIYQETKICVQITMANIDIFTILFAIFTNIKSGHIANLGQTRAHLAFFFTELWKLEYF